MKSTRAIAWMLASCLLAACGGEDSESGPQGTSGSHNMPEATGGGAGTGGSGGSGGTGGGTGGSSGASSGSAGSGGSAGAATGTGGTGGAIDVPKSDAGPTAEAGVDASGEEHPTKDSGTLDAGNTSAPSDAAVSGDRAGICKFASGLNNPWIRFGNDVPNPDMNTFKAVYKNTFDKGGRIVRWWFHTNGSVTPGYDGSGKAKAVQQSHIDGVKSILTAAHDAGVAVVLSLWSFDMLQDNAGSAHTSNQALLEQDANRQAYINNYLTPFVTAIKGTPGLYAYEIFNEPEGMTPNGWATYRTQVKYIQTCVNQFAAAIRAVDPNILITNGTQVFQYNAVGNGKTNNYSDSALRAAGGKQTGVLDFYEVHYYSSNGTANSPFLHPASYWGLDKKLVMGEFYAVTTDGVQQKDIYTYLYNNGYSGGWGWAYDANWKDIQIPMKALYDAHSADLKCP